MKEFEGKPILLPEPGTQAALKNAGGIVRLMAGDSSPAQLAQDLKEITKGEIDLTSEDIIAIMNGDFSSLGVLPTDQNPPEFTTSAD